MPKGVSHYTTGTLSEHRIRNILSGIKVEFEGDWIKANIIISTLPQMVKRSAVKAQTTFAKRYKNQLRENIRNNGRSLGWEPLSPKYARWKDRQGGFYNSSYLYRFYGTYYNSIDIIKTKDQVSIGISKSNDKRSPHSGLRVSQYALILEMGSYFQNIPARKLWGPSFKQIGGRMGLLMLMRKELNLSVKAYGITLS